MKNEFQSHSKRTFFYRVFLLLLPFLGISLSYFYFDPFKVLYSYKDQEFTNYYDNQPYELNREIMSVVMLGKNRSKYSYNSFIFGSCESFVFHSTSWIKYLNSNDVVFHFPAASESIYGINHKVKYLHRIKIPIKNCLVIIDNSTLRQTEPRNSTTHVSHPDISGETIFKFHFNMFKNFFSNMFCIQYIDYRLTGKVKGYMKNNMGISPGDISILEKSNEYYYSNYDNSIVKDSIKFYNKMRGKFYYRDSLNPVTIKYPIIGAKQISLLKEIKQIFEKEHTNYFIIISPMYDQVALNKNDLKAINNIFEEERVYDFSGINKYTRSEVNYYDNFHYKPYVADEIMKEIYKSK